MTFLKEAMDFTTEEEQDFYNRNLEYIYTHIRFFLDHLDDGTLWVYRVSSLYYEKVPKDVLVNVPNKRYLYK